MENGRYFKETFNQNRSVLDTLCMYQWNRLVTGSRPATLEPVQFQRLKPAERYELRSCIVGE